MCQSRLGDGKQNVFKDGLRKYSQLYAQNICLSEPMINDTL